MNLCEKLSQPEFTAGPDEMNSGRVGFCSVSRGNTSFHIGKINWVGKKKPSGLGHTHLNPDMDI